MKKHEIYEALVEGMEFPGKGCLEIDGTKVTVKYALPGQKIRFAVSKLRKGKAEGRLMEVLERSPLESETDVCPHAGICGSCIYQSLPYPEQLKYKEAQVRQLIEPVLAPYQHWNCYEGILPSPLPEGYRNKMEFSFGDAWKDGPLALGMHKRSSFYDIVNVPECRNVHEDFRRVLRAALTYCTERDLPFYRKLQHTGYLRHLLVRRAVNTGEMLVCLVTSSQYPGKYGLPQQKRETYTPDTGEKMCLKAEACTVGNGGAPRINSEAATAGNGEDPEEQEMLSGFVKCILETGLEGTVAGILHIVNDSLADIVQSDRTEILYGKNYFYEELLGLKFKITPFSFFQTNTKGAEVLYSVVREYICGLETENGGMKEGGQSGEIADGGEVGKETDGTERQKNALWGKVVFDLYSGTGTIAQILAPVARKVIGVEIIGEAVQAAKENAAANGLGNCIFLQGDVLKVLDEIRNKDRDRGQWEGKDDIQNGGKNNIQGKSLENPDYIILDPPREGIHPKALPKIIAYGAECIVYISCKPTSLARDLGAFLEAGYRVERWKMVDMFPMTVGIETCVLLRYQGAREYVHVAYEPENADYLKDMPGNASYREIKEWIQQEYGLMVSSLYVAQVKRKHGIIERENYNTGKDGHKVPQCPPEKEQAIEEALRYFRMI